jgi:PAS domain S-box-containing protein
MALEYTPVVLPYAAALLISTVLFAALWRHRDRRGAKGFLLDVFGLVFLSATVSLQVLSTSERWTVFWWNWRFAAVSLMAIGYFLMAFEYTNREEYITYRLGAALTAVPVATQAVAWTNDQHGLLYDYSLTPAGHLLPEFGILYWAYAIPLVTIVGVGMLTLVRLFLSMPDFKLQAGIPAVTISLVLLGLCVWWLGIVPFDTLTLTSTVKVVSFYFAVDRLQLLDVVPVARTKVLDNMDDAVFVVNLRDRIVDANGAARDLAGDEAVVGEPLDALFDTTVLDVPEAADEITREITLDMDGDPRHYDLKLSSLYDARESITGRVLVLRDITELKDREKELTVLNRVVRHDIGNEMNVIQGHGEALRGYVEEGGEQHLEHVLDSSAQVTELTETVRDLTNTVTSDETLSLHAVPLGTVIHKEVDKARSNYPEATFEVAFEHTGSVRANEMLSSVFTNLFNNAVLHNDTDDPRIWISMEQHEDVVHVQVADNGPGVPPDQADELFGRGVKGLESEGTGVGLYLVDTLVTGYGGEVWVDNGPDGGAIFTIELRTDGGWEDVQPVDSTASTLPTQSR